MSASPTHPGWEIISRLPPRPSSAPSITSATAFKPPLEYDKSHKGYYYTDPTFQLPVIRISEEEILALLISRKLITEASTGSLADELGSVSKRQRLA